MACPLLNLALMITPGTEFRRNPRVPVERTARLEIRPPETMTLSAMKSKVSYNAVTHDVSRAGLCVTASKCETSVGSSLSVALSVGRISITLQARVAWMRSEGDGVRMGLRLLPELSDAGTRRTFDTFVGNSERAFATS